MRRTYKISVVVPVYNAEKYVERCIDSIVCQTYEQWELILVDDGSSDGSGDICDRYSQNDTRIVVFHQGNQGVSVARNLGLDNATGDILVFVDADDWFEKEAFDTINEYWDESLQLLVYDYYDAKSFDDKERKRFFSVDWIEFDEGFIKQNNLVNMIIPGQKFLHQTGNQMIQGVLGKAFACSYIKEQAVKFPVGVFMNEDCVFNICAVRNITRARYISKPLYNYFINDGSATFQKDIVSQRLIENYENCCQYIKHVEQMTEHNCQISIYDKYVIWTIKIILWRTASEKNYGKREMGRKYCKHFIEEISLKNQKLGDYIFLSLLQHEMYGIVEKMISLKKLITYKRSL